MSAISGTLRAYSTLRDGTLRITVDIDPRFKSTFHEIFPEIDMPAAIAPLVADFERLPPIQKPKVGPLCQLAARWCKDEVFREWLGPHLTEEEAAEYIRTSCLIKSRAELDSDPKAADHFNQHFRVPYMDFLKSTLKDSNVS